MSSELRRRLFNSPVNLVAMRKALLTVALALITVTPAIVSAEWVTFVGIVTDSGGQPLENTTVEIYRKGAFLTSGTTFSNGYFSIYVPSGEIYDVVIFKKGYEKKIFTIDTSRTSIVNLGKIQLEYALKAIAEVSHVVAYQGSYVVVPLRITNIGTYTVMAELSLSVPTGWGAEVVSEYGLIARSIVLEPGASNKYFLRARIPATDVGTMNVTLHLSYYDVKHCLTVNFDVKHRSWRIVEFKFPEIVAYPGSIFRIPLRVFNPLEEVYTVDLSIIAPSSWTAWFEVNGQYVNALTLDPGSFTWLNLTVRVPENAVAGNYTIAVEGRSLDVLSKAVLQVRIESRYDAISMEMIAPIVDAEPGSSAVIPLTIRNDGTGASLVTFYAVGLPIGYLWHLKDEQGNVISALRLPPRSSQRAMLFVDIPGNAPPTAIGFIFRAVGLNSSTSIELGVNVKGKAAVEVEATSWEIETVLGAPARFTLVVRNNGQIPVNDLTIQVGGTSPEGLHVDVIPNIIENLPPGGSTSFTVTVIPEERAAYGRYYIPLVIVGKGVREERVLVVNIRVGSQLFYLIVSIAIVMLAVFTLIRQLKRRGS